MCVTFWIHFIQFAYIEMKVIAAVVYSYDHRAFSTNPICGATVYPFLVHLPRNAFNFRQ